MYVISQTLNVTITTSSSEEEPCTSSAATTDFDFDWCPTSVAQKQNLPEEFTLNFRQKEWIKNIIPAADRLRISNENLFYLR